VKDAYRSEIDGLRAIAVLAVLAFHAWPNHVRGGFVGVDIFFVISGFLITGLIDKDLEQGTFSLAGFYARRVRRIFPALVTVFVGCLAVGWIVLLPDEFRSLGKQVGAAAAFVANLAFLQEVDYFDTAAEVKPLLHLWSLGVEEQFYVVWPLLMLLSWRAKASPLVVAGVILTVSFAWNVAISASSPAAAFYLPVTRFWELMLGCLLALATSRSGARSAPVRSLLTSFECLSERGKAAVRTSAAWLGAAAIVFAILLFEREKSYPGWWALWPAMGALLLISAGPRVWINRRVLSHPTLVYVGLISYPLYLWHWPILAAERIVRLKEPTVLIKMAGLGVAFLLAVWTYKFIEKPIRFGSAMVRKPIVVSIALGLVGCLGLLIYAQDGFRLRIPTAPVAAEWANAYRLGRCFLGADQDPSAFGAECERSDGGNARRILLWGDSHAAHLFPGLEHLERREKSIQVAQYAASGCPPVLSFSSAAREHCAPINDFVRRRMERSKPEIVIMAARWQLYQNAGPSGEIKDEAIRATVRTLKSSGVEHVVGIGQFPDWEAAPSKIRARISRASAMNIFGYDARSPLTRSKTFLNLAVLDLDRKIGPAFESEGATFISPASSLCDNDGCLLLVPNMPDEVLAWDTNHLSKAGSIFFVESNAKAFIFR